MAHPPADQLDLDRVLATGRRRVRVRRVAATGAATLSLVSVVALAGVLAAPGGHDRAVSPAGVPHPDGRVLHLADARDAAAGRDYRELTSYTNEDLDSDNGQYLDGMTDDGLVVFRDGPRMDQLRPRLALMDPATGREDWLPDLRIGQTQTWPVELGRQRLVLAAATGREGSTLTAYVFDRAARRWSEVRWPSLPDADDAGAQGDTYHLFSLSLGDGGDVRDEGVRFGDLAFSGSAMVWTDSTNGAVGRVRVRDLRTGAEHAVDPGLDERCNLLSFDATADRVVMSEYCGTYGGERDDRVQVTTTGGAPVATLQGGGIDGSLADAGGRSDVVVVTSREHRHEGTYAWDPSGDGAEDELLRLSTAASQWAMGGPVPDGHLMWTSPANHGHGATQHLDQLVR